MGKGTLLGIVWVALVVLTAWWVYKNLRPGLLK